MFFVRAYRRRRQTEQDPGNAVFGSIGWLFADLMFALAMAFLVATTVGQPPREDPPTPPPTTTPPTPSPTPSREPILELKPVEIVVRVNWVGLLAGDAKAEADLAAAVQTSVRLQGRHAGLVLTFGGAQGDEGRGIAVAKRANDVLRGLGAKGWVFRGTVCRPFLSLHEPPQVLKIDVYLFRE
ncbi:hypothetical protein AB0M20_31875 [Actinoplanes sp. NPDC051633]|uniref:hypothetical protein n=1 Tax=Actinoplanes sp. NPDC051633 TaxID=3155670 RepID=UPI0034138072